MFVMADDDLPAGLVDPEAPDADARRSVATYFLRQGIPIEQVRDAFARESLTDLVAGAALWPDTTRVTLAEVADRVGMPEELARRVRRMFGATDPGDDALCRPREVEMIGAFAAGAALFGEERTLQFTRVMGTSAAAIAEAAITLFAGAVGAPLREAGRTDAEVALEAITAMYAYETVCDAVDVALRLHFEQAVKRIGGETTIDELTFAVAFVDVVGSTAMSDELAGNEVAAALRDFDRIVAEAASQHDARLVKLIGDGAMLAARELRHVIGAVDTAVTAVGEHPVLKAAKAGVTLGPVAAHDGDYFGRVVNLAARVSSAALPGEVLLDAEAARQLPDRSEAMGDYDLKGFAEPVALYRLVPQEGRR